MKGNGWVGGLIHYIRSNGGHNATKMVGKHKKAPKRMMMGGQKMEMLTESERLL